MPDKKDLTDEQKRERLKRFVWQPGDVVIMPPPKRPKTEPSKKPRTKAKF
jgi:alkylated DNA repair dioxygenase AlkB